jgi:hypothetical protein
MTFVVVEGNKETEVVVTLRGAAMTWNENPEARRVYAVAPVGPYGTEAWQRVGEVYADELRAALRLPPIIRI